MWHCQTQESINLKWAAGWLSGGDERRTKFWKRADLKTSGGKSHIEYRLWSCTYRVRWQIVVFHDNKGGARTDLLVQIGSMGKTDLPGECEPWVVSRRDQWWTVGRWTIRPIRQFRHILTLPYTHALSVSGLGHTDQTNGTAARQTNLRRE